MKRNGIWIISLISIMFITGCGNKTLTCTKEDTSIEDMQVKQVVDLIFSKDKITHLKTFSTVKVSGIYENYMEELEETLTKDYADIEKEKGFKVHTEKQGKTLTIEVNAELQKLSDNAKSILHMSDTKKTLEEAKKSYENEGYVCE